MRHIHKWLGTGCFFLCLGGWGYNGQVIAEDAAKDVNALLNQAVAAAAAPAADAPAATMPAATAPAVETPVLAATPEIPASAAIAPASAAPVVVPATAPAAEAAATTEPASNLNSPVVAVSADGTVEQFDAPDLDINTALYLLSLQTKRNIIASKEVRGTVTAHLHNVSFSEALDALLTPNGFGYVEKGNFIYVYSQKELEDIKKRDRKTVNRVFHLKYMTAADASILVKPVLSSTGQIALTPAAISGLPSGTGDTGGPNYATDDTLVINDYPENLNEVEKTLKELDVRPKQVLVESTILRATLKEDNAMGIDFVSLSGIDFSTLTSAAASTDTSSSGGFSSAGALAGTTVAGADGTKTSTQTNVGTNFAGQVPQGGLSVGFLSNHVAVFLRALEETTDTTVVANPKILALNKHRGEVFIGQQFGYKTTTQTQTTSTETIQFLDTGTKLIFRPYITDDGYVRMEIHPEDSSGGLNSAQLPEKQSTEVTSNLMIKDGRTVVIGGLFREQTTAGRGQVPVLGNIPILGIPFRRTADNTVRTETVVLITPHIINDDTALYEESEKKQEDATRMMLGNRAGLQPWGRDRLAQTWYAKAQESLEKGNREQALMYTDWALNTNPRFLEAIKLREQLTQKKVQEANESTVKEFVRDVLRDDAATTPDSGGGGHYPAPATQP